jgi:uncharacterized membrane protein YkvA (DUF1232 family)
MKFRWKERILKIKAEIEFYRLVLASPDTPRPAKLLLGCAIAYALSPIDLIPDFIPILGHLDDALIVPFLIWLAFKLIPDNVLADCRKKTAAIANKSAQ